MPDASLSKEERKARKRHFKSTKNRPAHIDDTWSPFRAAEKKYKARYPPLDLSDVLDLSSDAEAHDYTWHGRPDAVHVHDISTTDTRIVTVPSIPGLVVLPSFLSPQKQRALVRWALRDHARPPNETNLDTHYVLPSDGLWTAHLSPSHPLIDPRPPPPDAEPTPAGPRTLIANTPATVTNVSEIAALPKPPTAPATTASPASPDVLLPRLRWANIGWFYHWGTKQYDFTRGKVAVDPRIKQVCRQAVASVDWSAVFGASTMENDKGWGDDDWRQWGDTYEPDAGIVNFYQTKDTLMAHVDRSEVCATSPLVSISIGNAAIFLIGGQTRDEPPVPILLHSGDVVMMAGPYCRRAYHGVPRILANSLPRHLVDGPCPQDGNIDDDEVEEENDWAPYAAYLRNARINVNVRQVFPRGFDPSKEDNHTC
ncbi:hypothetical protein CONPUDRAFT_117367 [Coniophora puteana RWD-64-598 SS2]|uniref:Fe2OG dioxygenase domain-containing protein n=1 Tax=Coniophora puteana (strain RWD-64-598) TaxID=741705 RepID=A0A5M3N0U4_CONPW|nr:uncharacterized protein CONPUDRAFT_117367 [Coniophora puteana RWD-64-598 SS2]EIW84998.1 hypothetical protein CONPUDRAFT_117367 [Coniophora puteana RWD-64-598 SS2]